MLLLMSLYLILGLAMLLAGATLLTRGAVRLMPGAPLRIGRSLLSVGGVAKLDIGIVHESVRRDPQDRR